MRQICKALTVAGALSWPTIAHAEGPYYYHKAGVPREAYIADAGECAELAGGVRVQAPVAYTPNLYAAAAAGLFSGLMQGAERRRLRNKVERVCMADKGYRRLSIGKEDARAVRTLDERARLDRLFGLAAATVPVGTELPE